MKCALAMAQAEEVKTVEQPLDLSALTTMLAAQWKGAPTAKAKKADVPQAGADAELPAYGDRWGGEDGGVGAGEGGRVG